MPVVHRGRIARASPSKPQVKTRLLLTPVDDGHRVPEEAMRLFDSIGSATDPENAARERRRFITRVAPLAARNPLLEGVAAPRAPRGRERRAFFSRGGPDGRREDRRCGVSAR